MLSLTLALLLSAVPAPDGDSPTEVWRDEFATSLTARPTLADVDFAGGSAFAVGSFSVAGGSSGPLRTYVRARDRDGGGETWSRTFAESEALGVTTNAAGTLVFAALREPGEAGADTNERLVVLAGADGTVLFEDVRAVPTTDLFATSTVDGLALSPSGLTLYRLEFSTFQQRMRLTALDTQTGNERWSVERHGLEQAEFLASLVGERNLAVAPDSGSVYVSYLEQPTFDDRDAALARFSAVDGAELWTTRAATLDETDRCSRPYPLPDGSGVVWARWFLPTSFSTVEKLAAGDGSSVWTSSSTLVNAKAGFDPTNGRFVLAAPVGFSSWPDGTELRVESFDVATGAMGWGATYPGAVLSDAPARLVYDATGADLYVLVSREENVFGTTQEVHVRALDAATGTSAWFEPVHAPSASSYPTRLWMDARPAGGVAAGWGVDLGPAGGLERTGLAGVDGSVDWTFETQDVLPSGASPVARVYPAHDGTSVWTRPVLVGPNLRPTGLRLERRALADGALLDEFFVPDTSVTTTEMDVDFSPYAPLAVLEVPIAGTFDDEFVLRDLTTHVQTPLPVPQPGNTGSAACGWSPDGTRLYLAVGGSLGWLHAIDLPAVTLAWSRSYTPPTSFPFGGNAGQLGVVVDPTTGDATVAWYGLASTTFGSPASEIVKTRYAAADGTVLWNDVTNATGLSAGTHDFYVSHGGGFVWLHGREYPQLLQAEDGGRLFFASTIGGGGVVRSLAVAIDPATGAGLWTRAGDLDLGTALGGLPGTGGVVDTAVSATRLFVLTYSDFGPHLIAHDTATGGIVWERFLSDPVDALRGIELFGEGLRLAVGVAAGDGNGGLAGARVLVLDATTGEELWRDEVLGTNGELCDLVVAADETLVLVGQEPVEGSVVGVTRRLDGATLQDGTTGVSVAAGGTYPLHLAFGADDAGDAYLVAGSSTGSAPPTPFAGLSIPLVIDAYTLSTLAQANTGVFVGTLGLLDASGDARARIEVPAGVLDASVAGATLHHAAVRYDTALGSFVEVTQAVTTTILP